ncbi:FMN-dependent 2-nitropropane dioxygenase [Hypoxylon fragiforme]|uniref:FMN-dependent 2-nitropropane dioxygenase n=1 Tax=Hypoxylon fragiforme TaxID=63214 RepID=UPI0020C6B0EF|nr:FMN-dependent 2-nitropropane dioxygenase [Hypoxylon fragiforme]KAI2613204.1 FMN-dependent 2-nitropropane dioxygenase [Hypoxylon fragiforme]
MHVAARRTLATMATSSRMRSWFPTTSYPLVVSAPMDFVTNPKLATEVTKAGGLGFIQGGRDFTPSSPVLRKLDDQLTQARELLLGSNPENSGSDRPLPIGVAFVMYAPSAAHFADTTLPILLKHRPAAIWLFAPAPSAPDTLPNTLKALRLGFKSSSSSEEEWTPKLVVQVGSVAAALGAAQHGADVVVAQGVDAGGHQSAVGAGIVSLVPEIVDALAGREVAVWAAGGIVDGRGVAAALALGAEGAVLGTRYMVAVESDAQDFKRKAILSTADGGVNTVKSQLHDHIQGNTSWPSVYDGRAIVTPTYRDQLAGVPLDENTKRFNAAKENGDVSRMVTWSGTGVGLIKDELPAAEITRKVREGALKVMAGLKSAL